MDEVKISLELFSSIRAGVRGCCPSRKGEMWPWLALSCRSSTRKSVFPQEPQRGWGDRKAAQWWLVAAQFCVKQKQFPEVAVLL